MMINHLEISKFLDVQKVLLRIDSNSNPYEYVKKGIIKLFPNHLNIDFFSCRFFFDIL